jgi:hypothetical protein
MRITLPGFGVEGIEACLSRLLVSIVADIVKSRGRPQAENAGKQSAFRAFLRQSGEISGIGTDGPAGVRARQGAIEFPLRLR